MPYLETPNELADWLADQVYPTGVYEDPECTARRGDEDHTADCNCRVFWVPAMADRIRQAVQNETRLSKTM